MKLRSGGEPNFAPYSRGRSEPPRAPVSQPGAPAARRLQIGSASGGTPHVPFRPIPSLPNPVSRGGCSLYRVRPTIRCSTPTMAPRRDRPCLYRYGRGTGERSGIPRRAGAFQHLGFASPGRGARRREMAGARRQTAGIFRRPERRRHSTNTACSTKEGPGRALILGLAEATASGIPDGRDHGRMADRESKIGTGGLGTLVSARADSVFANALDRALMLTGKVVRPEAWRRGRSPNSPARCSTGSSAGWASR